MPTKLKTDLLSSLSLVIVILFTYWLYLPGQHGTFVFDDTPNLTRLDEIRSINDVDSLLEYTFTQSAGTLGRPVSYFSFALQFYAWNSSPETFLATNIYIHLLNGVLIFWLFLTLTKRRIPYKYAQIVALTTSAIWLLHPLNTSTVLYIVQRMTELSALFSLAALIIFSKGLAQFEKKRSYYVLLPYIVFFIVFIVLATFSKENGILTLLFAFLISYFFYHNFWSHKPLALLFSIGLALPIALLFIYLAFPIEKLLSGYNDRPFTLEQRVLTQPRILFDYLGKIIFPQLGKYGLHHDGYTLSTSLISPTTTLFAIAGILISIISAYILRNTKYWPFSFALLWFFAAHSLESSFIPLMMYFEHRNYMASIGIIYLLSLSVYYLFHKLNLTKRLKYASSFGLALYFLLFSAITYSEVYVWGNPKLSPFIRAIENPDSKYNKSDVAGNYIKLGRFDEAVKIYKKISRENPKDPSPLTFWLTLGCLPPEQRPNLPSYNTVLELYRVSDKSLGTIQTLSEILEEKLKGRCEGISDIFLLNAFEVLSKNNNYKSNFSDIYYLYGMQLMRLHKPEVSVEKLQQSYKYKKDIDVLLLIIELLINLDRQDEASQYYDQLQNIKTDKPIEYQVYKNRIIKLKQLINPKAG